MGCFDFNCAQMAPGETESDLACVVQFGAETDLFNLRCTRLNKKYPSEMAFFLWYNQSRYDGLLKLTSFRENPFSEYHLTRKRLDGYKNLKLIQIKGHGNF